MKVSFSLAAALAATFSIVAADQAKCGAGAGNCPSDSPCCSSYGQCGVGAYCLGGCDPQNSFSLSSCVAAPQCKTQDYKLTSLDDIAPNTKYLGDASKANWVVSGIPVQYQDSVLLTMAPNTVGTLISSTHYVWYGKISATLSTSQGAGVVTAFIMMSDVKDEIDFEFIGVDLQTAQSNFYYQGITNYNNEKNLSVSDTRNNMHTYTIDWQPDSITWSIDGNSMRTLKKSDTWNATTNTYNYPQTPARVQLSLWPAGLQSNGQGTVDWAGGLVDWNSQYMQNGYYYARVSEVNVQCYDKPSNFSSSNNHGDDVYYYTSRDGTQDSIATGNNNTILSSFQATGDNPSFCQGGCSSSVSGSTQTATGSSASSSATQESVPGMSGGGNAGSDSSSNSNSNGGSGGSGSGSGGDANASGTNVYQGPTNFNQGLPSSTAAAANTKSNSAPSSALPSSAVALLGFLIAALML